ncbi:MAG: hypothetical protein J4N78_02150, partial [Chloroflexi bacterium]|nr:hypothetical protein [Chloroflexota bacterium]
VLASIVTGNSEDARLHASAGLDRAERPHHRWWLTTTLWGNQTVSQLVGDWRDAREFGDRGLAAAPNDLRMVGNRALLEYEAGRDEHGDIFL